MKGVSCTASNRHEIVFKILTYSIQFYKTVIFPWGSVKFVFCGNYFAEWRLLLGWFVEIVAELFQKRYWPGPKS